MRRWWLVLALFACDDGSDGPALEGDDAQVADGASADGEVTPDGGPAPDGGEAGDARAADPDAAMDDPDGAVTLDLGGVEADGQVAADGALDAARPEADSALKTDGAPVPDTALPPADGAALDPDAAAQDPDAAPLDPDAAPLDPDAAPLDPDAAPPEPDAGEEDEVFSFFVTSLQSMRELSGSEDGFGGDLGGLEGADGICQRVAAREGFGHKTWRAFLSATDGGDGEPVHAIERIGDGPWFDRNGRLVAVNVRGLLNERPAGDPAIIEDLPDEYGVPLSILGDSHDVMTGSNPQGRLDSADPRSTCNDWTSANGRIGGRQLKCGHSWPRSPRSGRHWISDHTLRGCAPGVNLIQNGAGEGDCVGCSGGYGAIYCFALEP